MRVGSGACGGGIRTLSLGRLSQTPARIPMRARELGEWPACPAIRPVWGVCPWGREPNTRCPSRQRNGVALSWRVLFRSGSSVEARDAIKPKMPYMGAG
jgi:hypothetical protein